MIIITYVQSKFDKAIDKAMITHEIYTIHRKLQSHYHGIL